MGDNTVDGSNNLGAVDWGAFAKAFAGTPLMQAQADKIAQQTRRASGISVADSQRDLSTGLTSPSAWGATFDPTKVAANNAKFSSGWNAPTGGGTVVAPSDPVNRLLPGGTPVAASGPGFPMTTFTGSQRTTNIATGLPVGQHANAGFPLPGNNASLATTPPGGRMPLAGLDFLNQFGGVAGQGGVPAFGGGGFNPYAPTPILGLNHVLPSRFYPTNPMFQLPVGMSLPNYGYAANPPTLTPPALGNGVTNSVANNMRAANNAMGLGNVPQATPVKRLGPPAISLMPGGGWQTYTPQY